jgi:GNAT superfamily N-acetyltransferase
MTVRPATIDDVPRILELIHELADYEREPDAVEATQADLVAALFPPAGTPTTFAHVATVDGEVVGMAIWFVTFSTWTGRNGIWLEDLFVRTEHRGSGLGRALLVALAQVCVARGWPRLEWTVLDWNEPSIAFYRSLGARPQDEWTTHRLTGNALTDLAEPREV